MILKMLNFSGPKMDLKLKRKNDWNETLEYDTLWNHNFHINVLEGDENHSGGCKSG